MNWYKSLLMTCVIACGSYLIAEVDSGDTDGVSKSYMNFPQMLQDGTPEKISGTRHLMHARENGWHGCKTLIFAASRTTNESDLARYFSPFGTDMTETPLRFGVDVDPQNPSNSFDVLADHFNILTVNQVAGTGDQFLSNVTIDPQQTVFGVDLSWRQSFFRNEEKGRGWWMQISLPIVHIKNDMNFKEQIVNKGGGVATTGVPAGKVVFDSMAAAFQQAAWNFGKIKTEGSLKKTRVADLSLRLGYEWLQVDPYHLESFFGLIIPTGNKPEAEYLFEPVVGNGKHFGIEWGATYSIVVWDNQDRDMMMTMEHSVVSKYFFQKKQVRSLDLKHKPWSRYVELYANQAAAQAASDAQDRFSATPGINVLTQEVDVTPGYNFHLNSAFIFEWKRFTLEGGYNLLARRSERVALSNAYTGSAAIKAFGGQGFTNPIRDITGNPYTETAVDNVGTDILPVPVANYAQSILVESDLDLNSASTPSMLAHTFYGNMAYTFHIKEWPFLIDAGASYTFAQTNNVVSKWMVWAKLGLGF